MDYNALLDMVADLSYRLALCGAETYRIEECVNRITAAYHIEAECFAIPNCLHITIRTAEGKPLTRMRRIGYHGNDLDSVEKFSNLSRRICRETPDPAIASEWIKETEANRRTYSFLVYMIGNFLGAAGFSVLFGAALIDSLIGGLCGCFVGLVSYFMDKQKANQFFSIILSAFVSALAAYLIGFMYKSQRTDAVIIGALMLLVPGLLFTNAMRDIIYGDTNSGINRIVQVLLIAAAIALGTAAAWNVFGAFLGTPVSSPSVQNPLWFEVIGAFVGCVGFLIVFNNHGPGGLLCALGGVITWIAYRLVLSLSGTDITAYFFATLIAAIYSEIMARIRKYPAISYLVISIFPLIPGAGVYYTMTYAVRGDTASFASKGLHTAAIAGVMAVGILLASTTVRLIITKLQKKIPS